MCFFFLFLCFLYIMLNGTQPTRAAMMHGNGAANDLTTMIPPGDALATVLTAVC